MVMTVEMARFAVKPGAEDELSHSTGQDSEPEDGEQQHRGRLRRDGASGRDGRAMCRLPMYPTDSELRGTSNRLVCQVVVGAR